MTTYARAWTGYTAGDLILSKYLADEFTTIFTALGTGGIGSDQLASLSVIEAKIGTGAVTETKIGTGAVVEAKLGTGAVTADKITDGTITAAKLAIVSPATYTGQESVTEVNGRIVKTGYTAYSANSQAITFATAFTTAINSLNVTAVYTAYRTYAPVVGSVSTTGFTVYVNEAVTGYYWTAIGY